MYTHVEDEILSGTIPGSIFTFANTPVEITNIDTNGSALVQYADATGSIARRDVLIKLRLNNADTEWNTGSVSGSMTGASVIFSSSIVAAMADNIIGCYSYSESDKTYETIEVSESGGGRPIEHIAVYGGKRFKIKKLQEPFTVDITVLKSDVSFAQVVTGEEVLEVHASGSYTSVRGGQTRIPKTLVIRDVDPENSNELMFIYFNVYGTGKSMSGPAEEHFAETLNLDCESDDKVEIHLEAV